MTLVLFPIERTYRPLVRSRTPLDCIRELWKARGFKSEASFLKEAGLSPGYLANLQDRLETSSKAGKRGAKVTISLDAAAKMARVLGVHAEQLAGGEYVSGTREDDYPERYWAVEAARFIGLPEAAIRRVERERPPHDLNRQAWFKRIEAEALALPDSAAIPLLPPRTAEQA